MKKDTKQSLRKICEAITKRLPEEHCHLGKDLDLLITQAWNEGQNEKSRADEQILTYARMDEEKIARQVEEQVKAIADIKVGELDRAFAARHTEWENRKEGFAAAVNQHLDSLADLVTHNRYFIGIDSIIVVAVGDVDDVTAIKCMMYAMGSAFREGEWRDDHVDMESYHIAFQRRGANSLCVIVWTQDEWTRTQQLDKAKNQIELVRIANRLTKKSRKRGVKRMAERLSTKAATLKSAATPFCVARAQATTIRS